MKLIRIIPILSITALETEPAGWQLVVPPVYHSTTPWLTRGLQKSIKRWRRHIHASPSLAIRTVEIGFMAF